MSFMLQPPRAPNDPFRVLGSRAPDAFRLGRLVHPVDGISNKINYGGERNLILFGPNGSGKGTRFLLPNLLTMRGSSIVVVDPKGELAAVTAPYRRTLGRVVILNPFGVLTNIPGYGDLKSQGFNPLARLDPSSPSFNSKAALLADALVTVTSNDSGNAKYFSGSGRALFAALIMYTVIEARNAGQVPQMARVRELLCTASGEGNPRLDMPPYGIPALALEMMESNITGLKNKAAQFTEWNKETGGIARTAMIETEAFDDDEMAADLAKDGFDFADLKREPVTVYLILPPEMMERHAKWLRLVLTSAMQSVMRERRPGEPRTLFMLDEFFALGYLQLISTVWALVRGYGIQIMPVLQDLVQLQKLYPALWQTFVGMAGAVMSFAPNDPTTAEWLSNRIGDTTRRLKTANTSFTISGGSSSGSSPGGSTSGDNSGWSETSSYADAPVKVPLINGHQLLGLQEGYTILTIAGLSNAIPAYAPAYYQIESCARVARHNPYFHG